MGGADRQSALCADLDGRSPTILFAMQSAGLRPARRKIVGRRAIAFPTRLWARSPSQKAVGADRAEEGDAR